MNKEEREQKKQTAGNGGNEARLSMVPQSGAGGAKDKAIKEAPEITWGDKVGDICHVCWDVIKQEDLDEHLREHKEIQIREDWARSLTKVEKCFWNRQKDHVFNIEDVHRPVSVDALDVITTRDELKDFKYPPHLIRENYPAIEEDLISQERSKTLCQATLAPFCGLCKR